MTSLCTALRHQTHHHTSYSQCTTVTDTCTCSHQACGHRFGNSVWEDIVEILMDIGNSVDAIKVEHLTSSERLSDVNEDTVILSRCTNVDTTANNGSCDASVAGACSMCVTQQLSGPEWHGNMMPGAAEANRNTSNELFHSCDNDNNVTTVRERTASSPTAAASGRSSHRCASLNESRPRLREPACQSLVASPSTADNISSLVSTLTNILPSAAAMMTSQRAGMTSSSVCVFLFLSVILSLTSGLPLASSRNDDSSETSSLPIDPTVSTQHRAHLLSAMLYMITY